MPTVNLSPLGGAASQFLDSNGVILTGGKIFTYAAGTSTPQATYTSALGNTPHTNPIVLDSAGRVPGGEIWLTDTLVYKFVIETATSILVGTYDNIPGINDINLNATNIEYDPPFAGALTSEYTVADKLSQTLSVKDFGAVCDGVTDDTAAVQAAFDAISDVNNVVVFPGNQCLVTNISITGKSKFKLLGLNGGGLSYAVQGTSTGVALYTNFLIDSCSDFEIAGMTFTGTGTANVMLTCKTCIGANVHDNVFSGGGVSNSWTGAQVTFGGGSYNSFRNNKLTGSGNHGVWFGVYQIPNGAEQFGLFDGNSIKLADDGDVLIAICKNSSITNNILEGANLVSGSGIILASNGGIACSDLLISNNVISNNKWHGVQTDVVSLIPINYNNRIVISDNIFTNNDLMGVYIYGSIGSSISNNLFLASGLRGITCNSVENLLISGNTILAELVSTQGGIWVLDETSDSSGISIVGNFISSAPYAIRILAQSGNTVSNVYIADNTVVDSTFSDLIVQQISGTISDVVSTQNSMDYTKVSGTFVDYSNVPVPATASSAGIPGQKAYDSGFFYVCISANTWKRTALATW